MDHPDARSGEKAADPRRPGLAGDAPDREGPSIGFGFLTGWRFWIAVAAFWSVLGFIIGNHVVLSMRGHGHDWGRVILWQMGGAAAWILLTPAVLALDRRFPLRPGNPPPYLALHGLAAIVFALLRLVPLTALSLLLDPFQPVAREQSFAAEYLALLAEWMPLDILIYGAVIAVSWVAEAHQRAFEERLRGARLRADLAAAELRALELEVQPHFLFNALNAINSLVRSRENDGASKMLVGLGDLFRATLKRRGRQLVHLREELDHVRLYARIQEARFGERLLLEVDVPEELLETEVPGLLLQPLVENAIRHGVERRSGQCRVVIRARREGSSLHLSVEDDGPGIEGVPTEGVGLANLRSRLGALYPASLYPGGWDLRLENREGGGARVRVALPAEWAESVR